MKIDLKSLKAASEGDQSAKVAVTKRWLRAVHDELERLSKNQRQAHSASETDAVFERIFGRGR